jgi:hypothetical protein
MLARKRVWLSLGRSAVLLGCHVATLRRQLDKPGGCGFTVHQKISRNGRRFRYLALDELLHAIGQGPTS